ncbi:PucR family transcriptional regulator [Amycolatopsis pigmentata]|uniref:PucR family transcriptional regulator n=1 Tax=Amycolatopsis pigmentata TaxID=450801 RepID=A0ABW5FNV1_9PSEU
MVVPEVRRALVDALSARVVEIAVEIARLTVDKIETVRAEHIEFERIRQSTLAHNEVLLHLLLHPEDLDSAEPPVGAISTVREVARRGLSLHEIIRSYQLSSARWYRICVETLATLTSDLGVVVSETAALSALTSDYLDRMCERVSEEYEDERKRWLQQEESVRLERVKAVLAGETSENHEDAERGLGYRLRQHHLAVIAWVDAGDRRGDELVRAQRAAMSAASLARSHGRLFAVAWDSRTVWAWVPQPVERLRVADLRQALAEADDGVRLALGNPAAGVAGFVQSHRQAAAAHEVGRISSVETVFPYQDVSALSFLVAQPERAKLWIRETLGPLADGNHRDDVLRDTLRTYLRSHQSATTTSRELNCHKNTVLYRIRVIEQSLGRAIDSDPVNIGLALQADRWLGSSFVP